MAGDALREAGAPPLAACNPAALSIEDIVCELGAKNNTCRATSCGFGLKRAVSTLTPGILFCANCRAKFMRANSDAEFIHSALALG